MESCCLPIRVPKIISVELNCFSSKRGRMVCRFQFIATVISSCGDQCLTIINFLIFEIIVLSGLENSHLFIK